MIKPVKQDRQGELNQNKQNQLAQPRKCYTLWKETKNTFSNPNYLHHVNLKKNGGSPLQLTAYEGDKSIYNRNTHTE